MKKTLRSLLPALCLSLGAGVALADDVEGTVESVDRDGNSFVVQGIRFEVNDRTDFDDGLKTLADLREGQRVEVDFEYRDGTHTATEVELED